MAASCSGVGSTSGPAMNSTYCMGSPFVVYRTTNGIGRDGQVLSRTLLAPWTPSDAEGPLTATDAELLERSDRYSRARGPLVARRTGATRLTFGLRDRTCLVATVGDELAVAWWPGTALVAPARAAPS